MNVIWIAAGAVLLAWPSNWVVRYVLHLSRKSSPETPGAGRWIGVLERLLIYALAIGGQAAAAGLVIAAKSILRFPEISGDEPDIDPEYVLVGSLTSWLIAFSIGLGVAEIVA